MLHRHYRSYPNATPATLQPGLLRKKYQALTTYGAGYYAGRTRRIHLQGDPPPDEPVVGSWLVMLWGVNDWTLYRAIWSEPTTGEYRFDWIDTSLEYLVLSRDHHRQFNAEALDRIVAIPYGT